MDWNDLRHFLAAYRHRSLAGAARDLGCEYTTVGRRLAALETALGTRLFTRTPDGLSPLPAAEQLMPLAEQVERATQAIGRRAEGLDERLEGVVTVTCAEGFAEYLIGRLGELRARHPALRVDIVADARVLDLTRGEADIAIRMMPTQQKDLLVRKLGVINWRMFASEDYVARRGVPEPITNLRGHDVIGFARDKDKIPGAVWLNAHDEGANVVLRCNTIHAVVQAAQAGLGLAVLPQFLGVAGKLELLSPEILGFRPTTLVVHPDMAKVARVRAVMNYLAEIIVRDHELAD